MKDRRRCIPVKPFQDRFHELVERGEDAATIAIRGDYVRNHERLENGALKSDLSRLLDAIGLSNKKGRATGKTHISEYTAKRLAQALDLDPVDLGF